VDKFKPGKSFNRIVKGNSDLVASQMPPAPTTEQFSLFRKYLDDRHTDGGMAEMTSLDYAMMVEDTHVNTMLIEYRLRGTDEALTSRGEGPLIAVALTDVLANGLSMVYSFFDTDTNRKSLGTYLILDHIRMARKKGLPYVYLGYWVEGSQKMEYKKRFSPQEHLTVSGWSRVD